MKGKLTNETYDKLLIMMRSSNMEDFFLGLELYINMERTKVLDALMIKSFGGKKRREVIAKTEYTHKVHPMFVTLEMIEPFCKSKIEKSIFKKLKNEYNKTKHK
tara:strand:+ start:337 stop:648 length:312 start_codon:yes stop_codon:yes gene_type:complete